MTLKLITGPAVEPLTLDEAKLHLKVDHTADDTLITRLIAGARRRVEHVTQRALITQTWELALDAFPVDEIRLSRGQLLSVVSVKYDDTSGAEQTLAGSAYAVDDYAQPGWLLPAYGTTWPSTLDTPNAVRVRFTAGYGPAATNVPEDIRAWMLLRIGTLHKHREELVDGRMVPPAYVDRLLDEHIVYAGI